jgi:hypothetical protein
MSEFRSDAGAKLFPAKVEEFVVWKRQIEAFLKVRDLLKYVAPVESSIATSTKSEASDGGEKQRLYVNGCDRAYSIIFNALNNAQALQVLEIETGDAAGVWKKLNETYGPVKSTDTLGSLLDQLQNAVKRQEESMKEYLGRMSYLCSQVEQVDMNEKVSLSRKKYYVMQGLKKVRDWEEVINVAKGVDMSGKWTYEDLAGYLISEDNARSMSTTSKSTSHKNMNMNNNNNAYYGNNSYNNDTHNKSSVKCSVCKKIGHESEKCRYRNKNNNNYKNNNSNNNGNAVAAGMKRRIKGNCFNCGIAGHKADDCYKKKNNNNSSNSSNLASSSSSSHHQSSSQSSNQQPSDEDCSYPCISQEATALKIESGSLEGVWILDSGATTHYTYDISLLYNIRDVTENNEVKCANNVVKYYQVGDTDIYMNNRKITLKNVACIPSFNANLLSVDKFVAKGATVFLNHETAKIKQKDGITLTIPKVGRLYMISARKTAMIVKNDEHDKNEILLKNIKTMMRLLHDKYGHVNYTKLYKMMKSKSVSGSEEISKIMKILYKNKNNVNINMTNIVNVLSKEECVGCLKGKMTRLPMTAMIDHSGKEIMQVWHVDTMIFKKETIAGSKYGVNIIDEASRKIIYQLSKSKAEIVQKIINTIKLKQTETSKILRELHADQGSEIITKELEKFLAENGTKLTTSVVNTPQHNSLIERANRTLLDMSKCMMQHSKCFLPLYGEATKCAAYVLERVTTSSSPEKTPYEKWNKKKPNIIHFHVFGCDVYYHNHKAYREHKFDETSKKGIFVGYDEDHERYYRIYDVDSGIVKKLRDVKFFDNSFDEMKRLNYLNEILDNNNYKLNNVFDEYEALPDSVSDEVIDEMFSSNNNNIIDNYSITNNNNESEAVNESIPSAMNGSNNKSSSVVNESIPSEMNNSNNRNSQNISNNNNQNINNNNITNDNNINNNNRPRSSRNIKPPVLLDPSHTPKSRTSNHLAHFAFMSAGDEPVTYKQALASNNSVEWKKAIENELESLLKNNTWQVVEKQSQWNVIGCRWLFKLKKDVDGNIKMFKARVVAKGYNQIEGCDFIETYAPVLKYKTLRVMLCLAALMMNVKLNQMDIKTAFLNAKVTENIYMTAPEGFPVKEGQVLKLVKALYGIKQAPNEWYAEISKFLKNDLGMKQCIKDQCVFIGKSANNNNIMIGLFVDDMVSVYEECDEQEFINKYKKRLQEKYELSDLGEVNHILGMRVMRNNDTLTIDQKSYIKDKLVEFNYHQCNGSDTPEASEKLTKNLNKNNICDVNLYRKKSGSLIYTALSTRPDIHHAVNMVSRYMHEPNQSHMIAVNRVLRYLYSNNDLGLVYKRTSENEIKNRKVKLEGYCDADWGGSLDDRKSTTGYCLFLNGCLVSWYTHKQPTVAQSSAEAEYMAATDIVKEIKWMKMILTEMNFIVEKPTVVLIDNQSAIKIAEHDVDHSRTKHIDIKYHFIREAVENKEIKLQWISTQHQKADIFTKALSSETFNKFRSYLVSKVL